MLKFFQQQFMKKLATMALLLGTSQTYAAQPIDKEKNLQRAKFGESIIINIDFTFGELNESQYIVKLKKCSSNGNEYCTASLGEYYLVNKKQYAQAYPLLVEASKDTYAPTPTIEPPAAKAYYNLGQMYQLGAGILQNNDKAIECFTKSATYGADRNSAIKVAMLFNKKWRLEAKNYEPNELLTEAYAWWKIAQALPPSNSPIMKKDGKEFEPSEMLSIFEKFEEFKPHIKEADQLASKICSTIPECIQ